MRLIDADNLRGRVCELFLCAEPNSAEERRLALVLGLIDSEHTITPPPNGPLTLEELREMDGEPVWILTKYDASKSFWAIVNTKSEEVDSYARAELFEDYWSDWLAYRRKLEEIARENGFGGR